MVQVIFVIWMVEMIGCGGWGAVRKLNEEQEEFDPHQDYAASGW